MSGIFWIALEPSIPKIGLKITLSLAVKKLNAFKFDGVAESGNTAHPAKADWSWSSSSEPMIDDTCTNLKVP